MKFAYLLAGIVLGGLFFNAKFIEAAPKDTSVEVVYGTRVGPDGNLQLVTRR
ncbi:hypothetical protein ST201phi2-1p173 [Pseudomonas phage 201phi2-1]|uniref:Uncharacterized protein n=1 Tax=Pseudomonas phage 201phi2-1 TaxID=198110 RepID=B3FJ36_BP201|nr:hypothetical protein ST201phi2-1p173 [Pseudomonas phage 201phi2-1]ABY63003.1 hypothetical protein 201phi2-1p173 [Pseudomonas phage 201phi2-1]